MRIPLTLTLASLLFLAVSGWAETTVTGTWSAPSLSTPSTPIIFTLLPDGTATEQVGTYQGKGRWTLDNTLVTILWDSGWTGQLRIGRNGFELLTWKKDSPLESPPDDIQPARRIGLEQK